MIINKNDFPLLPSQAKRKHLPRITPTAPPANTRIAMATLNDLPYELVHQILEYLPCLPSMRHPRGPLDTFKSLSLTNRRLHYMVQDKLYAAYRSTLYSPYLFLRTCASNKHIAETVKAITFTCSPVEWEDKGRIYCPSLSDRGKLKDACKSLDIPGWKAWATQCNDMTANPQILLATILMHTPNINSLYIVNKQLPYETPKWLEVIRHAVSGNHFGRVHLFRHLRSIRIQVGCLTLRQLMPLFRLPSLRTLSMSGLDEDSESESRITLADSAIRAGSSAVEELELSCCFVQPNSLVALINACRALRKFVYDHEHHEDADCLRYPPIVAALRRHCHSLENLQLSSDFDLESHPFRQTGIMGNLNKFKSITHLKSSLGALVDVSFGSGATFVETLPPSLKSFDLAINKSKQEHRCVAALEHMVSYCKTFVPLLETIRVETSKHEFPYDWDRLRKTFLDSVGVIFTVDWFENGGRSDFSTDEFREEPDSTSERDGYSDIIDDSDD